MNTTEASGDASTTGANNGDSNNITRVVSSVASSVANAISLSHNSQGTAQIFTTPTATHMGAGPIVSMSPNVAQQPIQVQVQGPTYLQSPAGYYYQNTNQMLCASYITPSLGSCQPLQLQLHPGTGIPHMTTAVSSPAKVATSNVGKTAVSGSFTMTPTSVATTAQFASQFKNVAPAMPRSVQQYPPNALIQVNSHSFIPAATALQPNTSTHQAIAAKTISIDKKQNIMSTLQSKQATIMPNVSPQTPILRQMPAQIITQNSPFALSQFQPAFQTLPSNNNWLGALSSNQSLAIIRPNEQHQIQYALHQPHLQTISVHNGAVQIAPSSSITTGHLPQTMVSAMTAVPTAIPTSATVTATVSTSHSQTTNTQSVTKFKPLAARPVAVSTSCTSSTSSSTVNTSSGTVAANSTSALNKSTNVTSAISASDSTCKSTAPSPSNTNPLRSTKPTPQSMKNNNTVKNDQLMNANTSHSNTNEQKNQSVHTNSVNNRINNTVPSGKSNFTGKINQDTRNSSSTSSGSSTGTHATTTRPASSDSLHKANQHNVKLNNNLDAKSGKDVQRNNIDARGTKRPMERKDNHLPSVDIAHRNGLNRNKIDSTNQPVTKKNEPSVLVHVIENFVIEESVNPFPVSDNTSASPVKENGSTPKTCENIRNENTPVTPSQVTKSTEAIVNSNGTKSKTNDCPNCTPKSGKSRYRKPGGKLCNNCTKKSNGTPKLGLFNSVVGNMSEYDFNCSNEADQVSHHDSSTSSQPEAKRAKTSLTSKKASSTTTTTNETRALPTDNSSHPSNHKTSQANGSAPNKPAEDVFIPTSGKDPRKWNVSILFKSFSVYFISNVYQF